MITCRDVSELVFDFVAGDLAPEKRAPFEQHLHYCPPCRAHCDSYRITILLARQLPCPLPPPDVQQRLRAVLGAGIAPPPPPAGPGGPGLAAP